MKLRLKWLSAVQFGSRRDCLNEKTDWAWQLIPAILAQRVRASQDSLIFPFQVRSNHQESPPRMFMFNHIIRVGPGYRTDLAINVHIIAH